MATWSDILQWTSAGLDPVLDDLIAERRDAIAARDEIAQLDLSDWSGVGADAARARLTTLESACAEHLSLIGALISATGAAQDGMGEVETLVNEAVELASFRGFVIDSSGTVSDPTPPPSGGYGTAYGPDPAVRANEANLAQVARLISNALTKAEETDSAFKTALDDVSTGNVTIESFGDSSLGFPDITEMANMSSEEVAAIWSAMSDAEKEAAIAAHPEIVGMLDGVDAVSRDKANRIRLDQDIEAKREAYEQAVAEHQANPSIAKLHAMEDAKRDWEELLNLKESLRVNTDAENARLAECESLVGEYARRLYQNGYATPTPEEQQAMDEIERLRRGAVDTHQLLVYDPATGEPGHERLRAAVSTGNVDTAQHVATFVPGMTTNVHDNMLGYTSDMVSLRNASESQSGQSVATVVWQGYDAPPGLLGAASHTSAERGGDLLRSFEEGIYDSRSHGGTDPHMSILGHSYGSTTSGFALDTMRQGVVDEAVFYGSPGIPVDSADDLSVPAGHIYGMRYDNDAITLTGSALGRNPVNTDGFTVLDPGTAQHTDPFSSEAHGDYHDSGSQAQRHLVDVVTGAAP